MCGFGNLKLKDVLPSFSTKPGNRPFKNALAFKLEFGCSSVSVLADVKRVKCTTGLISDNNDNCTEDRSVFLNGIYFLPKPCGNIGYVITVNLIP